MTSRQAWSYTQGDWSVMVAVRRPDGSVLEIPRAFLEGDFPKGTFKVSRRKITWAEDGVGYPSNPKRWYPSED